MRRCPVITAVFALFAVAGPALACLWDYDTLRAEAKGLPGVAEIITGRFERNPPLYYEMRLERTTKLVEQNAHDWEAYDSAAVACDRLGLHDEAIDWMARKLVAMEAAAESAAIAEHRYRYLANLGTFHAHRWFARGADRTDISDIQRARELIAAAIELNPDAHFGRERYQSLAINWVIDPHEEELMDDDGLMMLPPIFLADANYDVAQLSRIRGELARVGLTDAVEGISGLIALGNAWQSIDVLYALALALNDRGDSSLAHLAELRIHELIDEGMHSLHPDAPAGEELKHLIRLLGYEPADKADIKAYYSKARAAADIWHAARTQFMLARLESGMHPDTHADFWDGYTEDDPPSLPNGVLGFSKLGVQEFAPIIFIAAFGGILAIVAFRIVRRIRRARAAAA